MAFSVFLFAALPARANVDQEAVTAGLATAAVPFIENQGQIQDPAVKYYAKTFGGTVLVTARGEIVYSLLKMEKAPATAPSPAAAHEASNMPGWRPAGGLTLSEQLIGAKTPDRIAGEERAATSVNYFTGDDPSRWRSGLPSYEVVNLGQVYEGVELKLRAHGNNVEKLFYIQPGAGPESIRIGLAGARGMRVNERGELEAETELGPVTFTRPVAYQESDGGQVPIDVSYSLQGQENDTFAYAFTVGEYDRTRELVIDPLLASTFLGGSLVDWPGAMAIDGAGNVYITGWTASPDFPLTQLPGVPYDGTINSTSNLVDVFVSKLDSNLTQLLASTYIGGSSSELAHAIAIDGAGDVYIAGSTESADYPVTPPPGPLPYIGIRNGPADVIISKFDGNLTQLLASTFMGGSSTEDAFGLAIDSSGNVYITGVTLSSDYPMAGAPFQQNFIGPANDGDAFVSKLDNALSILLKSTFLGGSGADSAQGIAIDNSGDVYITGMTISTDFPSPSSGIQYRSTPYGGWDGFAAKLDSTLTTLAASTYIGGTGLDKAMAMALGGSGDVYITGFTQSTDFPGLLGPVNPFDGQLDGVVDGFVARLDGSLTQLQAATLIGGNGYEQAEDIAIDGAGAVYITGFTTSSDYPTTVSAFQNSRNGSSDAYVTKFNGSLSTLLKSTYIGGSGADNGAALALDGSGKVYVAGFTESFDYPTLGTPAPYSSSHGGGTFDAFVAKFGAMGTGSAVSLPRTGQTMSHAAYDDGMYQAGVAWPNPARFTITYRGPGGDCVPQTADCNNDPSDDVVTDNLTGLILTREAGTPTFTGATSTCTGGTMDWQHALDYVVCLNTNNYLGRHDWRVPNINELKSLVHYGQTNTLTWLTTQGFGNIQPDNYWSSTSGASNTANLAWAMEFDNTIVDYDGKANTYYVWPVRGGQSGAVDPAFPANIPKTGQTTAYDANSSPQTDDGGPLATGVDWPSPRFTITYRSPGGDCAIQTGDCDGNNNNDIVTDNLTTLIWPREAGTPACGPNGGAMHWPLGTTGTPNPLAYVTCLNSSSYLGRNDWRLPNINELQSLVDHSASNPALPAAGQPFVDVQSTHYWSSTAHAGVAGDAWSVDFWGGGAYYDDRPAGAYVWPVRGGTLTAVTSPAAFTFTDQTGVALSTLTVSNSITVTGINAPATVSISGGEYAINGSGSFTSAPGTVNNGDTVQVRQTSSASYSTPTNTLLTIGTVSDTFSVTTLAFSGNVPPNTPGPVTPTPGVTVTFPNGTTGGTLTATPTANPANPTNYRIVGGVSYDIQFSGNFTPPVIVCLTYNQADVNCQEANLKLLHWENPSWQDITTSVDTTANIICGQANSFSPFAVVEAEASPPPRASYGAPVGNGAWALLGVLGGLLIYRRRVRSEE